MSIHSRLACAGAIAPHRFRKSRSAFTLVELLVVIAIIGVLVGLLLPAVQAAREASRRSSCINNLKQLTLATHNYESAYKVLPARQTGTGIAWGATNPVTTNVRRVSGWVMLLPFIEQQALSEKIQSPLVVGSTTYPAGGPTPQSNTPAYPPWREQVSSLLCPSDGNTQNKGATEQGRSNYRFSAGDSINRFFSRDANPRGVFRGNVDKGYPLSAVTDGTSNTVALSERLFGQDVIMIKHGISRGTIDNSIGSTANPTPNVPLQCLTSVSTINAREYAVAGANWSGRRWASGLPAYNGFNTVFPPNAPSCFGGNSDDTSNYVLPPTSNHPGGAVVSMVDGSVTFITESIDAGDPSLPERLGIGGGASPYGIWGGLGSRAGGEFVTVPAN